jgi:lipase chaperone LimK
MNKDGAIALIDDTKALAKRFQSFGARIAAIDVKQGLSVLETAQQIENLAGSLTQELMEFDYTKKT